jgi:hypothetical protein
MVAARSEGSTWWSLGAGALVLVQHCHRVGMLEVPQGAEDRLNSVQAYYLGLRRYLFHPILFC